MIVATAGHVDHGKSTLVRLMTGTDPDRWEEERRRGLTIDLGFAWLTRVIDGRTTTLGFVDVPGHRRFLANMVAGVGDVDIALLVVSARAGWMPQTEEHLQILDLLDVSRGVVALTHSDRVDRLQLAEAFRGVRAKLAGTALCSAPVLATAPSDRRSISSLEGALFDAARCCEAQRMYDPADRPRLWIDRSFTISGAGRVITGTLAGGALGTGEQIQIVRGGAAETCRVRSMHVSGSAADRAVPGSRVGLNIVGADRVPQRGDAVVRAGHWTSGHRLQVAIRPVRSLHGPIPPGGGYQVFVGTSRATGQLRYPGSSGDGTGGDSGGLTALGATPPTHDLRPRSPTAASVLARVYLATPIGPLGIGDRFVLRDEGTDQTVGGGVLLAIDHDERRYQPEQLRARERAIVAGRSAIARVLLEQAGGAMRRSDLEQLVGPCEAHASNGCTERCAGARTFDDWVMLCDESRRRRERLLGVIEKTSRAELPGDHLGKVVAGELASEGVVSIRSGEVMSPDVASHAADLDEAFRAVDRALSSRPQPLATTDELRVDAAVGSRFIKDLVGDGRLVLAGQFLTTAERFETMSHAVEHALRTGPATVSALREALGLTRKYAVPVLEKLDEQGRTARRGDRRVWAASEGSPARFNFGEGL